MPAAGPPPARSLLRALFAAYLVALAGVTLGPAPFDDGTAGAVRRTIAWLAGHGLPVTDAGVEAAANVALFVPYGVLGALLLPRRRTWAALLAATASSAAIETIQRFLPTRYATVQDWALNTLGAALGVALVALVVRTREKRHDEPGQGEGRARRGAGPGLRRPSAR